MITLVAIELQSQRVRPRPTTTATAPPATLLFFILFDEVQAFRHVEMLYLSRFYSLFWALVATCVLGVLSSRFSFIVPLIFDSKYIDDAMWDYRFVVMTLQVMTVPLLVTTIFLLRLATKKAPLAVLPLIPRQHLVAVHGCEEPRHCLHPS